MKTPKGLQALVDDGLIDEVLLPLKSGKEASVYDTFRKHFSVCFWAEREGTLDAIRRIGPDNVLFMTDWPHPTCLYPDPIGYHQSTLEVMEPEVAAKIFGRNAEKLYRMDLSQAPAAS